ncbi:MAG: hypothetical protein HY941_00530 [Gammaproteobacteria bacterium]|nr:hypothetical protein [Gammaproteobacteria bacterium]
MAKSVKVSRDPKLKDGSPLRRYVDFAKYVDILRTGSLYFRRADRFTDRFEGALTPSIRRAIDEAHRTRPDAEDANTFYDKGRKGTYVSCWTFGAKDNMALWQLFGGTTASVAIHTNVERLTKLCLSWQENVLITQVQYIDHFENPDMVVGRYSDLLKFKHLAYDFEREVRIMIPKTATWKENPEDMLKPIGALHDLVTSVTVAPDAKQWFIDLVKDVSDRYGLKVPIRQSQLASLPA